MTVKFFMWWCCYFCSTISGASRPKEGGAWNGYDRFHKYPHPSKNLHMPKEVMVDVVNNLGLKMLAIHNEHNENNIAISPYGALAVLVALGEGIQGEAVREIQYGARLPNDISIIRIGLRDIHRHLKSYFIPKEGFLAGLTLSRNNVTLNAGYEEILKYYGYDTMSFNSALYPEPETTTKSNQETTTTAPSVTEQSVTVIERTTDVPTVRSVVETTDVVTASTAMSSTEETTVTSLAESTETLTLSSTGGAVGTTAPSIFETTETVAVENPGSSTTVASLPETTVSSSKETTGTNAVENPMSSTEENPAGTAVSSVTGTIVSSDAETTVSSNAETTVPSVTETTVFSDAETTVPSVTETTVFSDAETTVSSDAETTVSSDAETTVTSDAETTVTSDAETTVSFVAKTTTSSVAETTVSSDAETTVTSDAETTVSSDAETTVSSDAETTVTSDAETTVSSDVETTISSVAEPTVSSDAETTVPSVTETTETATIPSTASSTEEDSVAPSGEESVTTTSSPVEIPTENVVTVTEILPTETSSVPIATAESSTPTETPVTVSTDAENSEDEEPAVTVENENDEYATNSEESFGGSIKEKRSRSNVVELNIIHPLSKRNTRSIIDHVIARYYDNYYPSRHYIPPERDGSFLIYGKYKEYHVNFMRYDTILPFYYIPHLDAMALSFPLDNKNYYLLLILPIEEDGINKLICDLRPNGSLKYIIKNLRETHIIATIPSFSLKGYVNLTPSFQKLGVRKIFEPRQADFSPMTNEREIYVTNIEQAITVDIRNYVDPNSLEHESNLYQYGATEFKADHPFAYFVIDSKLQLALMSGKIVNPLNKRIR